MRRRAHDETQADMRGLGWRVGLALHRLLGGLLVLGALILTAPPAWAYWASTGTGTGSATTATLSPPIDPVATPTAGNQSVEVSWTAADGLFPDGYFVTRIAQDGSTDAACGSSPQTPVASPCIDSPTVSGTFHYTVTAVFRSWTAMSSPSNTVTVVRDTTGPTVVSIVRAGAAQAVNAGPLEWTVTFSEPVAGVSEANFALTTLGITGTTPSIQTVTADNGSPSATWTVSASASGATGEDTGSIRLDLTTPTGIADDAGNALTTASFTGEDYSFDTTAPRVTGVSSPLADGSYRAGQVVDVTVTFNEPVTVTGTPTLILATGSPAGTPVAYTGGSGTATLTFTYTVEPAHTSPDLDYVATDALSLNGAVVADAATNDALTTLPAPAATGSLGNAKNLIVDTTAPIVAVTHVNGTATSFPFASRGSITSIGGTCGTATGDRADVNVLVDGATASTVPCTAGSWTFAASWTTEATRIVSATQQDAAGNTGTAPSQAVSIDVTRARVIEVSSTLPNGTYGVGQVIPITVTFDEPVFVTGTPTLILSARPKATTTVTYTSGSGTDTLTFTYTVAPGDSAADLDYDKPTALSGTMADRAGNAARTNLPAPGTTGSLGANKDLVIVTTAPLAAATTAIPIPTTEPEALTRVTEPPAPATVSELEGTTSTTQPVASQTTSLMLGI